MLKLYKTYSFQDKDPIIDSLRTIFQDQGLTYTELAARTNLSTSTISNWFTGPVRRPQHASLKAAARGMGWDYRLVADPDSRYYVAGSGQQKTRSRRKKA